MSVVEKDNQFESTATTIIRANKDDAIRFWCQEKERAINHEKAVKRKIEKMEAQLADKEAQLADKDAEIERLKKLLSEKK